MNRNGRVLLLSSLLSLFPSWAMADDNTLLVPSNLRCSPERLQQDLEPTLSICQQQASQGDDESQYQLGEYFYQGQLTPRDFKAALSWFEQASLRGNAKAQLRLGGMFYRGEGVAPNNVQAYIVLKMASINGSDEALDLADRISLQMPREELEIASQVLGQIMRSYLMELQAEDGNPFIPLPQ